ncbi:MAG: hypothetical protein ACFB21_13635 [Opitutales bacterium]
MPVGSRPGGKSPIRTEADGHGMPPDEALVALETHATGFEYP